MAKEDRIGALWYPKSDNPRAPFLRGTLEVQDKLVAKEIASALVNGGKVDVVLWKNTYHEDGDNKPAFHIEKSKPYARAEDRQAMKPQAVAEHTGDDFPDDIPF